MFVYNGSMKNTNKSTNPIDSLRIDKWLWAARFFKTRALAVDAIKGGKIKLISGEVSKRVKPALEVKVGNKLEIQRGAFQWVIEVTDINKQRGSATMAQALYQELPESVERRAEVAEQLKAQPKNPFGGRKPDKRTLRQNRDIKRGY